MCEIEMWQSEICTSSNYKLYFMLMGSNNIIEIAQALQKSSETWQVNWCGVRLLTECNYAMLDEVILEHRDVLIQSNHFLKQFSLKIVLNCLNLVQNVVLSNSPLKITMKLNLTHFLWNCWRGPVHIYEQSIQFILIKCDILSHSKSPNLISVVLFTAQQDGMWDEGQSVHVYIGGCTWKRQNQ